MTSHPRAEEFHAATVAIVGVGLLGGSIAAALKRRHLADHVVGVGRHRPRLQAAQRAGLLDSVSLDLEESAGSAELIVVCTPVDRIAETVRKMAPKCRAGTLVTDVGSVKAAICRELAGKVPEGMSFIGSHPMAGSEKQGYEHADSDLFQGRVCVVTPGSDTPQAARDRITRFWQSLGLKVVELSAEDHDRAVAETSHLPHVVAAALASSLSEQNRSLAATGFADTTRIAAGDPHLWVAILLNNADELVRSLDRFSERFGQYRDALEQRDPAALQKLLQDAKTSRDGLSSIRG